MPTRPAARRGFPGVYQVRPTAGGPPTTPGAVRRAAGVLVLLAVLAVGSAAVWWWPGLEVPAGTGEEQQQQQLLSTLAQSLAAVVAIVLGLAAVVVEVGTTYAQRPSLRDPLMLGFGATASVSVVLSLWLLAAEQPSPTAIRVAVNLGVDALLLLVPFVVVLVDNLRPERALERLEVRATRAIRRAAGQAPSADGDWPTAAIDNFAMSALGRRHYDDFAKATEALGRLAATDLRFAPAPPEPLRDRQAPVVQYVLQRLLEIGLGALDDPAAVRLAVLQLGVTGRAVLTTGQTRNLVEAVTGGLQELGTGAAGRHLEAVDLQVIEALHALWRPAVDHEIRTAGREYGNRIRYALDALTAVATETAKANLETATLQALLAFGDMARLLAEGRPHHPEFDPTTPTIALLNGIEQVGQTAVGLRQEVVAQVAARKLAEIGTAGAEGGNTSVSHRTLQQLASLAARVLQLDQLLAADPAFSRRTDADAAIRGLGKVGEAAALRGDEVGVRLTLKQLAAIGDKAGLNVVLVSQSLSDAAGPLGKAAITTRLDPDRLEEGFDELLNDTISWLEGVAMATADAGGEAAVDAAVNILRTWLNLAADNRHVDALKRIVEAVQAVADRSGEVGLVSVHASADEVVRQGRAWLAGLENSDTGPAG